MPESYPAYIQQRPQAYMTALPFAPASEDDVATAILTAATDQTDQLRFVVWPDAAMMARMRWKTSEQACND